MNARRGLLILLCGFLASVLRAHDPGLSTAIAKIHAKEIEVNLAFAPADVSALLPASSQLAGKWQDADFAKIRSALEALAPVLLTATSPQGAIAPREVQVELAAADSVNFHFVFDRPSSGPVEFRDAKLAAMTFPPGHREFFSVSNEGGKVVAEKLLSGSDATISVAIDASVTASATSTAPEPVQPTELPTFWGFLKLGVEHIWTGYDHLLFLFGLLVVCRTFKSIVTIISCFTLAHSITLALATLNVVNIPSRFVEPAIAASIVFVGVENLLRRGAEPKGRWALTFFFGLIHGFGFASVLRELGVGSGGQGLAMPLFTFNLGVEMGQIAVASIALPIVWQLRKNQTFLRRGVPILSALVAAAGLYWFLERTVFS